MKYAAPIIAACAALCSCAVSATPTKWEFILNNGAMSAPLVVGNYVYVGMSDQASNYIAKIDNTGNMVWKCDVTSEGAAMSTPLLWNDAGTTKVIAVSSNAHVSSCIEATGTFDYLGPMYADGTSLGSNEPYTAGLVMHPSTPTIAYGTALTASKSSYWSRLNSFTLVKSGTSPAGSLTNSRIIQQCGVLNICGDGPDPLGPVAWLGRNQYLVLFETSSRPPSDGSDQSWLVNTRADTMHYVWTKDFQGSTSAPVVVPTPSRSDDMACVCWSNATASTVQCYDVYTGADALSVTIPASRNGAQVGADLCSQPAVVKGNGPNPTSLLVVYDQSGTVAAVEAETGRLMWTVALGSSLSSDFLDFMSAPVVTLSPNNTIDIYTAAQIQRTQDSGYTRPMAVHLRLANAFTQSYNASKLSTTFFSGSPISENTYVTEGITGVSFGNDNTLIVTSSGEFTPVGINSHLAAVDLTKWSSEVSCPSLSGCSACAAQSGCAWCPSENKCVFGDAEAAYWPSTCSYDENLTVGSCFKLSPGAIVAIVAGSLLACVCCIMGGIYCAKSMGSGSGGRTAMAGQTYSRMPEPVTGGPGAGYPGAPYVTPTSGYQQPAYGGAPQPAYGAPQPAYGASQPAYGAPQPAYGAPAYGATDPPKY